jgi:hypothetical protein
MAGSIIGFKAIFSRDYKYRGKEPSFVEELDRKEIVFYKGVQPVLSPAAAGRELAV